MDRKQIYNNTSTGLAKTSHERLLNDKGRKVIKEQVNDKEF